MSSTRVLREEVNNGIVDADFLIYHYASVLPVPQWVNIDDCTHCGHCQTVLKSGKKHNCRLDGKVYCSACTTKLHLPEQYELKGKTGPTRVCYGCRMSLLRMRQAAEGLELDAVSKAIRVPTWQDKDSFRGCNKCARKVRSPHNCRCCGLLHCDDCSSKQDIALPRAFNKKNKDGPQRVCDSCRFRLFAGAVLTDQPLALPPAVPEPDREASVTVSTLSTTPSSEARANANALMRESASTDETPRYQPKDPFAALDHDLAAFSLSRRASRSQTPSARSDGAKQSLSAGSDDALEGLSKHKPAAAATNVDTPHPDATAGTAFVYPDPEPRAGPAGLGARVLPETATLPDVAETEAEAESEGEGSSEVHIEDHVLPSQLRRTVAEAYIPLPAYKPAFARPTAMTPAAKAAVQVSVVNKSRVMHDKTVCVGSTKLAPGGGAIDNHRSSLVKRPVEVDGEAEDDDDCENARPINMVNMGC